MNESIALSSFALRGEVGSWRTVDRDEQQRLRIWMGEAPLDLDQDSPELEAELLKAVEGPHALLVREELEQITERAIRAFG